MAALHVQLDKHIEDPDSLSSATNMARATRLVVDITRMPEIGPRLGGQRDELSRLLKRAATPLTVSFVSDNATDVSIYKVGKLGSFETISAGPAARNLCGCGQSTRLSRCAARVPGRAGN